MSPKKKLKRGRPTIFKKAMTARERKARSRANIRAKQEQLLEQVEDEWTPEFVNTTKWDWNKWTILFLGITLSWFQLIVLRLLDSWLRIVIRIPRRHGKSTIILRIFMTRKICETRITGKDVTFAYISSDPDNVQTVVFLVYNDLTLNEKIIENYGFILGRETVSAIEDLKRKLKKRVRWREYKNTQFILNSGYRKNVDTHTLFGVSIAGKIRGKGFEFVFIDDPVDTFHTVSKKTLRRMTKKIYNMIQAKIIPLAIKSVAVIGTTYDQEGHDIFTMLEQQLNRKIWKSVKYKAISVFGEYRVRETTEEISPADIIIDKPEEWELLSPFIWDVRAEKLRDLGIECTGLQLAVYYYHTMDRRFFLQEYQNEAVAVSDYLQYDWLNDFTQIPSKTMKWGVMVDVAIGETEEADYNAFSFVGFFGNNYYIYDILRDRWTPKQKQITLEEFMAYNCERLDINIRHVTLHIEAVLNQRGFFQQVRDHSFLIPRSLSPAKRGVKIERIKANLGYEAENNKCFIHVDCRNKQLLREEMESFPSEDIHDDIIDSIDQNMFTLKAGHYKYPVSGRTFGMEE